MGPSPAKPGVEISVGSGDETFYGVYIPQDVQTFSEDHERVSTDKSEALKLIKKYKKARFKAFRTRSDAMQFAIFGLESTGQTACSTPPPPPESGEKPSPFRGPKPQDMVRFRKCIEARDFELVRKTVWENPRYLVSSGDTPAILQEGSRYNALHIAAKARDATICAFILKTVSSVKFMQHLYGDSTDVNHRCAVLLDLYLNTPDKALNETPLHFATKFGADQVVKVLVAYPQCDRTATNKFNQTAKDVICSRMNGADMGLKEEISAMMNEQFYVPVLRSPDNSIEPLVGQPFSPTSPLLQEEQRRFGDALSPVLEVQALAGPMPRQTAELFRRRWKTPPRIPGSPLRMIRPTLTDQEKGWEIVGRELAQEWKVAWKEYWPFLDAYTDLSSDEGLQLLEDYLHRRFKAVSCPTIAPEITVASPSLTQATPPAVSPMSELCSALQACRLSSGGCHRPASHDVPPLPLPVFQNGGVRHSSAVDNSIPTHVSPQLYIEKSCQVFAKRIADGLQLSEDWEFLEVEMRHLNSLVSSCQGDSRFSQLDFCRLHSHLGFLVASRLQLDDLPRITDCLHSLVNRGVDNINSSDEEEVMDPPNRRRPQTDHYDRVALRTAVVCLARAVVCAVESATPVSETDSWAQATPCTCTFLPHRYSRRKLTKKKLHFNEDEFDGEVRSEKGSGEGPQTICPSTPADSSGEESDTSDTSDGEFFTPPSSPGLRSDDDQAMESSDEGPDVYINGNVPSKLDISVLEAVRDSEVSQVKFPNICRWKHLVMLHSHQERLSWVSSPKPKVPSSPMWSPTVTHN